MPTKGKLVELVAKTQTTNKGGGDSNASDETPKDSSSNLAAHTTTTNGGEEKTTGIKRYRGKSAICDNCKEQYDVSNNHKGDCLWHEGMYLFLFIHLHKSPLYSHHSHVSLHPSTPFQSPPPHLKVQTLTHTPNLYPTNTGITITLQNDSGDLYIDRRGKFWDDHDEKILDRIQLEDMRNEYSQGFAWSCCGTSGDDDGCKAGRHVERILEESKRARYG